MSSWLLAQSKISWLADPLVLLALAVSVLLTAHLYLRRRRVREVAAPPPSPVSGGGHHRQINTQILVLMDELEESARQMSAQLDARSARLEGLIREADTRLASLQAALARAKAGQIAHRLVAEAHAPSAEETGLAALSRHREIYEMADAGHSAPDIAQQLGRPSGEVELILALRGSSG